MGMPIDMGHRLQIILKTQEYLQVQRAARRAGTSMSHWVRDVIRCRLAKQSQSKDKDPVERLRDLNLPAPPIEQMLKEIERGRS